MSTNRPFVLTIAGFDPSGGAGVLADVKTFEQHRVSSFAINTGNTIQTKNEFFKMY
jgi:hydroxymethylpyrimidine/phosphomethylpyrimidine kinase